MKMNRGQPDHPGLCECLEFLCRIPFCVSWQISDIRKFGMEFSFVHFLVVVVVVVMHCAHSVQALQEHHPSLGFFSFLMFFERFFPSPGLLDESSARSDYQQVGGRSEAISSWDQALGRLCECSLRNRIDP